MYWMLIRLTRLEYLRHDYPAINAGGVISDVTCGIWMGRCVRLRLILAQIDGSLRRSPGCHQWFVDLCSITSASADDDGDDLKQSGKYWYGTDPLTLIPDGDGMRMDGRLRMAAIRSILPMHCWMRMVMV